MSRAALSASCLVGLLCLGTAACGYRLAAPNSVLPSGLNRVRVPVFMNRTAEPGAEALFTEACRQQLEHAGRLGGDEADGVLRGELIGVASGPLVASPNRLPSYRLAATVALRLEKDGRVVSSATVSGGEDFPSGADVLWTETYRAAALRRVADSMMREGLERLTSP